LVVDDIIARADLAMSLALIVISDPPTLPGEHMPIAFPFAEGGRPKRLDRVIQAG
jgi:hypothetical protein